jgi:ABC-type spermidine/putrescine transport system permease subunit II
MALNPILLFGVIIGAIASIIVYLRSKNIKDSIIALVIVFLAFGTPFHFVIVGAYLGSRINRLMRAQRNIDGLLYEQPVQVWLQR